MSRHMSHDASTLCGPRCLNLILPFDPEAPSAFEMGTFLQMVSHSFNCRFPNCYLTAGSLNCRSIKEAVQHFHLRSATGDPCTCLTCWSFGTLYARHIISCRKPRGQCPFVICGSIKKHVRRQLRHQAVAQAAQAAYAQAQAQADQAQPEVQAAQAQPEVQVVDSSANGLVVISMQMENASAQQPNNDLSAEIQQNSNVDVEMTERMSQSPTSTSETLLQNPGEESNAQIHESSEDRQNPGT